MSKLFLVTALIVDAGVTARNPTTRIVIADDKKDAEIKFEKYVQALLGGRGRPTQLEVYEAIE